MLSHKLEIFLRTYLHLKSKSNWIMSQKTLFLMDVNLKLMCLGLKMNLEKEMILKNSFFNIPCWVCCNNQPSLNPNIAFLFSKSFSFKIKK